MPLIAALIGGLFTSLFAYLAKFYTKKIAVAFAIITLLLTATTAFIALISGLMASVVAVSPPFLSVAIQLVVPDNAATCMSAILTARIARWAYEWNVRIIQYKLF